MCRHNLWAWNNPKAKLTKKSVLTKNTSKEAHFIWPENNYEAKLTKKAGINQEGANIGTMLIGLTLMKLNNEKSQCQPRRHQMRRNLRSIKNIRCL